MSRVRVITAGMLVAIVAVFASTVPVFAHDELVASNPQPGEQLDAAPESVSLEFSDELIILGDTGLGATLVVVDRDGRDWVEGSPTVQTRVVTADLAAGMPEAGYELRWQVVSSDGHPISGVIPFTIGDAPPLSASATSSTGNNNDSGADDSQAQTTSETRPIFRIILIGAFGAGLAVAALALIHFFRRRTRADGTGVSAP